MVTVRTPLPAVVNAAPVYLPVCASKLPPLMVPKSKVSVPVPMLAVGYGSQALRQRVRAVAAHPSFVRWVSGAVLVALGAVILREGMLFAGT